MHKLKQLITGKKEKNKKAGSKEALGECHDDEDENNNNNNGDGNHYEIDFDKQFEQAAKRTSRSVPPLISKCDYRGSLGNRSKSPSPYPPSQQPQQQHQQHSKNLSAKVPAAGARKCSDPLNSSNNNRARRGSSSRKGSNPSSSMRLDPAQAEKDKVKRKLTETQQRQAKDIVESINWIQPVAPPQVCYASSVQPQIVQSQMIVPQICEALPIVRPGKAMAIIPLPATTRPTASKIPQPLAASGKVVNASVGTHRKPA